VSSLSNCRQLQVLGIFSNSFKGGLPDHVGNLSTKLRKFYGGYNRITVCFHQPWQI
jgi:hypothetical protein